MFYLKIRTVRDGNDSRSLTKEKIIIPIARNEKLGFPIVILDYVERIIFTPIGTYLSFGNI